MKTVAIIPFYSLNDNFEYDKAILQQNIETCLGYVDQVIVVNDGTPLRKIEFGILVNHKENLGKSDAIRSGIKSGLKRGFDYFIECDSDDDYDLNEIRRFLDWEEERNVLVIGDRYNAPGMLNKYRENINLLQTKFFSMLEIDVRDSVSGFRAYSHDLAERFLDSKSNNWGIATEEIIIAKLNGAKIINLYLDYAKPRSFGTDAEKLVNVLEGILSQGDILNEKGYQAALRTLEDVHHKMKQKEEFSITNEELGINEIKFRIKEGKYTIIS